MTYELAIDRLKDWPALTLGEALRNIDDVC